MDGQHRFSLPTMRPNRRKESSTFKGPLRVFRLCLLSVLVPVLLIAGPLYLRYRVFSEQIYPLGISDMRLVDSKISTTWCQKQLVKSNGTFSAYLLPEEPKIKSSPVHVSMVRYLNLEDDMKEYWGFYLLKGSSVTVSTCCSICAPLAGFFTDESSYDGIDILLHSLFSSTPRIRVSRWPGASLIVIKGRSHLRDCAYFGDNSSEELQELEEIDKLRAEANKKEEQKGRDNPRSEVWPLKKASPNVEFHRQESITSDELSASGGEDDEHAASSEAIHRKEDTPTPGISVKEEPKEPAESQNRSGATVPTDSSSWYDGKNSEEVLNDIMNRIASLGNRSGSVISGLRGMLKLGPREEFPNPKFSSIEKAAKGSENITQDRVRNSTERLLRKRDISLGHLEKELNAEDEKSNHALEEGVPAFSHREDIRGRINGTTTNDMSNSEFWSSFSSSEERLLSCAGLILNLPLNPNKRCHPSKSDNTQYKAGLANKLTYEVSSDGYYFFVFSSENEIQPNYIRIQFNMKKMLYNVSNPVAACTNTTDSCSLPLNFFSTEKVVLEMPFNANESLWNQEYVVVSVCEPRTMIYAACIIAVPILILLFAF